MSNVDMAAQVILDTQLCGFVKPRDLAEALEEAGLLKTEFEESELSRLYGMETVVERGIRKGWLNECKFEYYLRPRVKDCKQ